MKFEDRAIQYFFKRAKKKYLKGKKEHGQGLDELPLDVIVKELEGEIIDLIFYYYRLKEASQKHPGNKPLRKI